jgi:hypothetical protein
MTEFILIIVIIIAIVYFIGKSKSEKTVRTARTIIHPKKSIEKPIEIDLTEEKLLYKSKGIKTFDIKGMFYQNLNLQIHNCEFIGYAKTGSNSHDMYAVEIYNNENKLLGYTPKGNKRLNISLDEWHNGKIIVWGGLSHDDYDDKWYGNVNIPVGFSESQLEKVERVLNLKSENQNQINKKEKTTEKYFEILNRHREISNLLSELKNPKEFYYSFPKNIIPSISSHLEKEENWEKLLELEKHQDLISELSEKFKETTLKRIETARKNVA